MANLNFPGLFKGPEDILYAGVGSPQALTNAWVNLGPRVFVQGAQAIGLWLTLDINLSNNARVRPLIAHTVGGALHTLPIKTVGASAVLLEPEYDEFNVDADRLMAISWDLDGVVAEVQFQVMVAVVGGTAGEIDAAWVTTSGRA